MRGMAPWREVSSRRCSSGARTSRAAGIGDLLPLAGRAVDDGDGLGVRRRRSGAAGRLRRRPMPYLLRRRRARAVIAARALHRATRRSARPAGLADRSRSRPPRSARRRAGRRPPAPSPRRRSTNSPSTPAITCGMRIGSLKRRRFFFAFWPSGALSSSSATAASPRES